jgi:hypothetical protein
MAIVNPFPVEAIHAFLAEAQVGNRFLFALTNAQRALIMASDAVGGLTADDRGVVDPTLKSCWAVAARTSNQDLREYVERLYDRMPPDWEDEYSSYNAAVNDALAALVYAIESLAGDDTADSAYNAANSMFELADHLLQRHRTDGEYANDLAAAAVTALAARAVVVDLEQLPLGAGAEDLRLRAISDGHRIAAVAP